MGMSTNSQQSTTETKIEEITVNLLSYFSLILSFLVLILLFLSTQKLSLLQITVDITQFVLLLASYFFTQNENKNKKQPPLIISRLINSEDKNQENAINFSQSSQFFIPNVFALFNNDDGDFNYEKDQKHFTFSKYYAGVRNLQEKFLFQASGILSALLFLLLLALIISKIVTLKRAKFTQFPKVITKQVTQFVYLSYSIILFGAVISLKNHGFEVQSYHSWISVFFLLILGFFYCKKLYYDIKEQREVKIHSGDIATTSKEKSKKKKKAKSPLPQSASQESEETLQSATDSDGEEDEEGEDNEKKDEEQAAQGSRRKMINNKRKKNLNSQKEQQYLYSIWNTSSEDNILSQKRPLKSKWSFHLFVFQKVMNIMVLVFVEEYQSLLSALIGINAFYLLALLYLRPFESKLYNAMYIFQELSRLSFVISLLLYFENYFSSAAELNRHYYIIFLVLLFSFVTIFSYTCAKGVMSLKQFCLQKRQMKRDFKRKQSQGRVTNLLGRSAALPFTEAFDQRKSKWQRKQTLLQLIREEKKKDQQELQQQQQEQKENDQNNKGSQSNRSSSYISEEKSDVYYPEQQQQQSGQQQPATSEQFLKIQKRTSDAMFGSIGILPTMSDSMGASNQRGLLGASSNLQLQRRRSTRQYTKNYKSTMNSMENSAPTAFTSKKKFSMMGSSVQQQLPYSSNINTNNNENNNQMSTSKQSQMSISMKRKNTFIPQSLNENDLQFYYEDFKQEAVVQAQEKKEAAEGYFGQKDSGEQGFLKFKRPDKNKRATLPVSIMSFRPNGVLQPYQQQQQ